jgi:hypothetical protein
MYQFELIIDLRGDLSAYLVTRQPNIKDKQFVKAVASKAFRKAIAKCLKPWQPDLILTNAQLQYANPTRDMFIDARWFNLCIAMHMISCLHEDAVSVSNVKHDLTHKDTMSLTIDVYPCRLGMPHVEMMNDIVSIFQNIDIKNSANYWQCLYLLKVYVGFRALSGCTTHSFVTHDDLYVWLKREIAESKISGSVGTHLGLDYVYEMFEHLFPVHVKHSDMDLLKSLVSRIDVLFATTTEYQQAFMNDLLGSKELDIARKAIADERIRS